MLEDPAYFSIESQDGIALGLSWPHYFDRAFMLYTFTLTLFEISSTRPNIWIAQLRRSAESPMNHWHIHSLPSWMLQR